MSDTVRVHVVMPLSVHVSCMRASCCALCDLLAFVSSRKVLVIVFYSTYIDKTTGSQEQKSPNDTHP